MKFNVPKILKHIAGITALIWILLPFSQVHALEFEHVMNIGSKGSGEGQFKYVEDFDLTVDGKY